MNGDPYTNAPYPLSTKASHGSDYCEKNYRLNRNPKPFDTYKVPRSAYGLDLQAVTEHFPLLHKQLRHTTCLQQDVAAAASSTRSSAEAARSSHATYNR